MIPSRAYEHSMRPSRAYEHSTKPGAHAYGHPMLPNHACGHSRPSRALETGARAYGHPMKPGFVSLRAPDDNSIMCLRAPNIAGIRTGPTSYLLY